MQKKFFLMVTVLLLALASFPLAAQDAEGWTCPEGFAGQTLSIYNWSTYIAEDTIPNFEAACGVTVSYSIFESAEQALTVLRQGNPGYDLAVPSDYVVAIMITEELIQPMDEAMIPNLANLSPAFQELALNEEGWYGVPYLWGTIGIGYSVEAFPDGVDSWEDLFTHDGPVAWLEDIRPMFGAAELMLGYDPNTVDEAEIEEAAEYLIDNGDNVVAIAGDDGQALLQRGDVDATVEYNGDIYQIIAECECEDYAYAVPSEGTNIWVDVMVIPADAPNPELAQVFIDYILDAQVGADLSNFTSYASPNQASIDAGLIDETMLTDAGIYPNEETMMRLYSTQELPDVEQLYTDLWDEVKLEVGG
jgi:spermidine/putrescine-binding protein